MYLIGQKSALPGYVALQQGLSRFLHDDPAFFFTQKHIFRLFDHLKFSAFHFFAGFSTLKGLARQRCVQIQ